MIIAAYVLALILTSLYSYALVDPNLTLVSTSWWESFRNSAVQFGYHQREFSSIVYIVLIGLLFLFHWHFVTNGKKFDPFKLSFIIGLVVLVSYPFLSHDFFNYLFDAKIFTTYHQNPYLHRALDFPQDEWLRFMQWTHRTYPYGPVFLLITLVPSFLSFGKLILNFILFKSLFVISYMAGVYFLSKMNRGAAIVLATSPLVIIEGLVNAHNDLIAVSLGLIGIYLLQSKNLFARAFLLLSGGIKYLSLPIIMISQKYSITIPLSLFSVLALILYLSITSEVQPWYFLNLFVFLPYYKNLLSDFSIFFTGLLIAYYPYVRFGGWDKSENIALKHSIILLFLGVNIVFYFFKRVRK